MRVGTPTRFNGIWYSPSLLTLYDTVPEYQTAYATRAGIIDSLFPTADPILVAGSPYGFHVKALTDIGRNAYSIDIFDGTADAPDAGTAARMYVGDATNNQAMNGVESLAGLKGNNKFPLIVVDDVISCADDDTEAANWCVVAANQCENGDAGVVHLLTANGPPPQDIEHPAREHRAAYTEVAALNDMLWHTQDEWRAIVPAGQTIIDFDTFEVY